MCVAVHLSECWVWTVSCPAGNIWGRPDRTPETRPDLWRSQTIPSLLTQRDKRERWEDVNKPSHNKCVRQTAVRREKTRRSDRQTKREGWSSDRKWLVSVQCCALMETGISGSSVPVTHTSAQQSKCKFPLMIEDESIVWNKSTEWINAWESCLFLLAQIKTMI